jgi:uncharacterized protein YcaQ
MEGVNIPPYQDQFWMRQAYKMQDMSVTEIAEACDVTEETIKRWLHKFELLKVEDVYLQREAEKSGEYTQDWRKSKEWKHTRRKAIRRANKKCEECGMSDSEHSESYGHGLHGHHIEQASDGGEKFNLNNVKVLCKDCHEDKH